MENMKDILKENGFKGLRGKYFRCIGDGVFQGVFECRKAYIDPESPEYSEQQRMAKYTTFGLWSLYSELPECLFRGEIDEGLFYPKNFLNQQAIHFVGPQEDCRIMREHGMPFLNAMKTQEQLVEAITRLSLIEYRQLLPQQIDLCGALLKCGRNWEAISRVDARFTFLWIRQCMGIGKLSHEALAGNLIEAMADIGEETLKLYELWSMISGDQTAKIKVYLKRNYEINKERILRYKIPVLE